MKKSKTPKNVDPLRPIQFQVLNPKLFKGITPFPPRYNCRLACSLVGNIVAASSPTVYYLTANTALTPFSGGGWPGVLTSSTATLCPAGFSNLCAAAGPYYNFLIRSHHLRVRMVPATSSDLITYAICSYPINPSANAPTGVPDMLAEPRCVSTRAAGGSTLTEISRSDKVSVIYGRQDLAIELDTQWSGSAVGNPGNPTRYYLGWTTSNGGTNGGAISYEVDLVQDIEFWNLQNGQLLDV